MKVIIMNILHQQMGEMLSGVIDKIGLTSIAGFIGIKASEEAGVIELVETISDPWGMPEYALLATTIGTITFIMKNLMGFVKEGLEARKAHLEAKIISKKLKDKK